MINLLPPQTKEAVKNSQRNVVLRKYIVASAVLMAVLTASLLGGRYYLAQQTDQASIRITDKQQRAKSFSKLETEAKTINTRITSIQTIQKNHAQFSVLLSDLAEHMPAGTAITSITLTGDDKKPVRLTVSANDYKTALSFRDSITASKRVSAADIESIKNQESGGYVVTLTFGFNPGEAK